MIIQKKSLINSIQVHGIIGSLCTRNQMTKLLWWAIKTMQSKWPINRSIDNHKWICRIKTSVRFDWARHGMQAAIEEAKRRAKPIVVLTAAANERPGFWRRRKSRATAAPQQQWQQAEDWCVHRLWFSNQTFSAHIHRSLSLQFSWLDYSTDWSSPLQFSKRF